MTPYEIHLERRRLKWKTLVKALEDNPDYEGDTDDEDMEDQIESSYEDYSILEGFDDADIKEMNKEYNTPGLISEEEHDKNWDYEPTNPYNMIDSSLVEKSGLDLLFQSAVDECIDCAKEITPP